MHSTHERQVCRCGAVLAQCRCPYPKTDRVVTETCYKCRPLAYPQQREPSNADKVRALARTNTVVNYVLSWKEHKPEMTWSEALEHMVIALVHQTEEQQKIIIDAVMRRPTTILTGIARNIGQALVERHATPDLLKQGDKPQ